MNITKSLIGLCLLLGSGVAWAHGDDDPLLTRVMLDRLEYGENNSRVLEADAWFGKDLHKAWFKTEIEDEDGNTETAELQALYSRAISPYWDLQVGLRHDFALESGQEQNKDDQQSWAVIGLQGLAPYFFEIDTALFIGDGGDTALRLEAEYELLLTQKWLVIPEIDLNFYGQNDPDRGTGSGLSDAEFGLRLAYYPRREVAPYVGYTWSRLFGNSASLADTADTDVRHRSWVAGLKIWF